MNNRELLQKSIDYIEENLKTEIRAKDLANLAGFSLFHYYKVFHSTMGMPVMQYVTRRRLLNAIFEISAGNKITDTALEYGFETHAGFYKAFKRELSLSPSVYIKKHKVKRPYKINLLQEENIMITHKKITEVLKNWNLENEKISDIYYENTGYQNDHAFYIGDEFVLKFSQNLGQLRNHIDISRALERAGVSSAVPIKTTDGEDIVKYGELYACLSKRLSGRPIKSLQMYEGDYKSKARFMGGIIAELHLVLENFDVAVNDNDLLSKIKDWALPRSKALMNIDDKFANEFLENLEELYPSLPKQIIHRDPNPSNILTDGENFGFIDFDLTERNVRIYDICYAATAILSETINDIDITKLDLWIELYKNIVYGYDSVSKLSEKEKRAMPYIIASNQLICTAYFSEQSKYQELYKANVKMTEWIFDNFTKLDVN